MSVFIRFLKTRIDLSFMNIESTNNQQTYPHVNFAEYFYLLSKISGVDSVLFDLSKQSFLRNIRMECRLIDSTFKSF